jgi:hypothetical protein
MPPVSLTLHGKDVVGEVALEIGPATLATERDRLLDHALTGPLSDIAKETGTMLAAAPHRYAKPKPGKDAEGLTHFSVRGLVEGDRLVPAHRKAP